MTGLRAAAWFTKSLRFVQGFLTNSRGPPVDRTDYWGPVLIKN